MLRVRWRSEPICGNAYNGDEHAARDIIFDRHSTAADSCVSSIVAAKGKRIVLYALEWPHNHTNDDTLSSDSSSSSSSRDCGGESQLIVSEQPIDSEYSTVVSSLHSRKESRETAST